MHTKTETPLRVALVHDWLITYRGGEKVLEAICEIFPEADLFTLFHTPGSTSSVIESRPIYTSFLNSFWKREKYYRYLLPLFPIAIRQFDFSKYDLIISSSHCVAKSIVHKKNNLHICYCHTPMRYIWDRYEDYFQSWKAFLIQPLRWWLQFWDKKTSQNVDWFIANSHYVAERISKYYKRTAEVIYPFVDLENFQVSLEQVERKKKYPPQYLIVSAHAPYKKIELAILACNQLKRQLRIIGSGQETKNLEKIAGPTIHFEGQKKATELKERFQEATALLFPGEEDFGIVPLEAMACGLPVIAFGRGGATETIIAGETGLFFSEQTVEKLCESILLFEKSFTSDPNTCRKRAEFFSKKRFHTQFTTMLRQKMIDFCNPSYLSENPG